MYASVSHTNSSHQLSFTLVMDALRRLWHVAVDLQEHAADMQQTCSRLCLQFQRGAIIMPWNASAADVQEPAADLSHTCSTFWPGFQASHAQTVENERHN